LVTLRRRYLLCPACGHSVHPRDAWLGLAGFLSRQAERLVCLAAASWSFDRASTHLQAFCGLQLSDTSIRAYAVAAGQRVRTWVRESGAAASAFAAASGDIEFSTDGTCINTREGWREMRLGIFAKRLRGEAATPASWDERDLPAPSVRVLFAGLWTAEQFGPQWRAWARRLGIRRTEAISIMADGAKWIWHQAEEQLPGAAGVLDIYHSSEHLHATARVLFGEGAAAAPVWVEARRQTLLREGAAGLDRELAEELKQVRRPAARESLQELRDYMEPHQEHTGYAARLGEGRAIGSGMVEGACKTVVGKRLKQTGARWRVRHAERIVALCGLLYSDLWDDYWTAEHN
jgi:hypothetical protein